ncbi:hypothetical protein KC345_g254 [Hortaea werneckii]|nr:hypothetical protein KC345_g254 [Hortaea werneckii]
MLNPLSDLTTPRSRSYEAMRDVSINLELMIQAFRKSGSSSTATTQGPVVQQRRLCADQNLAPEQVALSRACAEQATCRWIRLTTSFCSLSKVDLQLVVDAMDARAAGQKQQ